MKPDTKVTVSWSESKPQSGTLSAYEIRYTTDGGSTYKTVSTNIGTTVRSYSFTPSVIDGQTLQVQICARNNYGKKSTYGNFTAITIYTDGLSVGKIGGSLKHLRAYVKVNGSMKKIKNIKVKKGGIIYSIDQYTPPK